MASGNLQSEKKGKQEGYTPKDVPVIKDAESEKDSFKKGGKVKKRASGGAVSGRASGGRLDKRASGGRMTGHSPLSSANSVSPRPGAKYDGGVDKESD